MAQYLRRRGVPGQPNTTDVSVPPFAAPSSKPARFALGRLPVGHMNRTEAQYEQHLKAREHLGAVVWWKFEGLKLRLADNCFYTPDFVVMANDGVIECHEVKGFWMEDAKAKIKVAASIYPFRFKAFKPNPKKHGGGWEVEDF